MEYYLLFLQQVHWSTAGRPVEAWYEISSEKKKKRQVLALKFVAPGIQGNQEEEYNNLVFLSEEKKTKDSILIGT